MEIPNLVPLSILRGSLPQKMEFFGLSNLNFLQKFKFDTNFQKKNKFDKATNFVFWEELLLSFFFCDRIKNEA